mmetsp:Transcript_294/g.956  ORF Transcript_294/g.956 Transcript_294/m.956 type:complete len:287 (+) Transcript_294:181-1041(+)
MRLLCSSVSWRSTSLVDSSLTRSSFSRPSSSSLSVSSSFMRWVPVSTVRSSSSRISLASSSSCRRLPAPARSSPSAVPRDSTWASSSAALVASSCLVRSCASARVRSCSSTSTRFSSVREVLRFHWAVSSTLRRWSSSREDWSLDMTSPRRCRSTICWLLSSTTARSSSRRSCISRKARSWAMLSDWRSLASVSRSCCTAARRCWVDSSSSLARDTAAWSLAASSASAACFAAASVLTLRSSSSRRWVRRAACHRWGSSWAMVASWLSSSTRRFSWDLLAVVAASS